MSAGAQSEKMVGKPAPEFSAKAADGSSHTLSSLTAKGPLFLYFIKDGCPINHKMVKYYNQLGAAYKGKATMVGDIDGDAGIAKAWLAQYKSPFPVLLDADQKIIQSYGALFSPWAVMVDKGKVAKVWAGGGSPAFKEINGLMAKAAGVAPAKLDLAGAPASLSGG